MCIRDRIGSTNYEPERTESLIRRMLQRNVDGVAVMTFGVEEELVKKLVEREFPLVFVDAGPDLPNIRIIKVDYGEGIRQGVQHLAALGHRSIAFISGPMSQRSPVARRDAFVGAMSELGLNVPSEHLVEGSHTMESGIAAMERLIALPVLPTAVMCSNDMTAIGALHALYRTTHRVPQDISVVGFDDIHLAQCLNYLKATGLLICLLINFGTPKIHIKRIVSPFYPCSSVSICGSSGSSGSDSDDPS